MAKLVVLHQGAIGDFLLTLSVIQAAREGLQADSVTAVATSAAARLAAGRSAVDTWLSPDDLGLYRLFCSDSPLNERMADLLTGADWVLSFLGGPADRIHERLRCVTGGQVLSVDPRPTAATRESRRHITQQWASDIRNAGWHISEPDPAHINMNIARQSRSRRVLIHPGSGGRAKCWSIDRFVALADALSNADVTWMLGPAELEHARRLQTRDEPLLVEEDLPQAAERMASFDLYVGNDSGMTHLGAAIGLPTIAIFGTTDPLIWRPLGDHVTVVSPEQPQDSMESVLLEPVLNAVATSISGKVRR